MLRRAAIILSLLACLASSVEALVFLPTSDFIPHVRHRRLNHRGRTYAVYEIKPVALKNGLPHGIEIVYPDPIRYVPAYGDEPVILRNQRRARRLLDAAYWFALKTYTDRGYINEENRAEFLEELESLRTGERTVILIASDDEMSDEAFEIFFMVSFHPDGPKGLPLEIHRLGRGLEKALPRFEELFVREFPDLWFRRVGPLYQRYSVPRTGLWYDHRKAGRKWVTGGIGEIKTLIGNVNSPEDFLVLTHQLLTQNARWSRRPAANHLLGVRKSITQYAYQWLSEGRDAAAYDLAPFVVPVSRNDRWWVEAPDDVLAQMYLRRLNFPPPLPEHRWEDKKRPGNFISLLSIDPVDFDFNSWAKVKQRPGGEVIREGYLSEAFSWGADEMGPSSIVILEPDEIAVNDFLDPMTPQLEILGARGREEDCLGMMLAMGNGNLEAGIAAYMGQFDLRYNNEEND